MSNKLNKDAYIIKELTPNGTKDIIRISSGKHTCQKCSAVIMIENIDDNYPNHENEPVLCPNCGYYIGDLRTSGYPYVKVIEKTKY